MGELSLKYLVNLIYVAGSQYAFRLVGDGMAHAGYPCRHW